jgi:hypothetical protein
MGIFGFQQFAKRVIEIEFEDFRNRRRRSRARLWRRCQNVGVSDLRSRDQASACAFCFFSVVSVTLLYPADKFVLLARYHSNRCP